MPKLYLRITKTPLGPPRGTAVVAGREPVKVRSMVRSGTWSVWGLRGFRCLAVQGLYGFGDLRV